MMNEQSRLFDFVSMQLEEFPREDMLTGKVGGEWKSYSTAEVTGITHRLAAGMLRLGLSGNDRQIEHQDKVAIISRNCPEWMMVDLACQQAGIVLCPIYPTTNVGELAFIFNDAAVKYVFVSGHDILEKVKAVLESCPSIKGIFALEDLPGISSWKNLLEDLEPSDLEKAFNVSQQVKSTDCATIIYTSGTTGTPKGVMLSHWNIVSNVLSAKKSFPFDDRPQGKALSFLPLNHIFERMITYVYINSGISIYYAESMETIGDNLKEIKPIVFCTVPRLLEKVYEKIMLKGAELTGLKRKLFDWAVSLANRYDNLIDGGILYNLQLAIANRLVFTKWREALGGNVEYIVTGSAACQVRLLRIFNAARIPIYEGYGPTENSPAISVNCRTPKGTKYGTVGLVMQGQDVKLMPDGEICVKGPSVMMGYYKQPVLTEETIINGWLHTGDIGMFDEGKYLKITDRKKELFKTSGGKYVAPQPIENKMKESAFIEQMMIVGAEEKFVGALIVPSMPNLQEWMREQDIQFVNPAQALHDPKVLEWYKHIIENYNSSFNHVEQVKKFELLPDEWTIDTGELTPTLKLKRKVIMEKYRDVIRRIYQ